MFKQDYNIQGFNKMFRVCFLVLISIGCAKKHEEPSSSSERPQRDPRILTDVYEREIWTACDSKVLKDEVVRRAAANVIKVNPKRNFGIDASSFFNQDLNKFEFTPANIIVGPGGDNFKFVTFCQAPKTGTCDMPVKDGDNRIEYKYWSYYYTPCESNPTVNCKRDRIEEWDVQTIHFTSVNVYSDKVCKRAPTQCPMTENPTWGPCQY